ncbi:MAG: two-component regulator propeller domain-containing protein [Oscillospiraceae bacterium]|nr:two-component regulator propeller domain-containing protein [Oscillospiraceae bacterium]
MERENTQKWNQLWLFPIGRKSLLIALACIAINLAGKLFAAALHLPIWLDSLGTVLAAYALGPIGGALCGVSVNLAYALLVGDKALYAIVSLVIGVTAGLFARKGYLNDLPSVMIASFFAGLAALVVSTPLNWIFYDGYTGNVWGDAFYDMLLWYQQSPAMASVAAEAIMDIVDKQLTFLLAYFVLSCTKKYNLRKLRRAAKPLLLAAVLLAQLTALCLPAHAAQGVGFANYVQEIYDSGNGLYSSEANAVAETDDGAIWIGSYAGLTRYNGTTFSYITEGGISNVTALFTDRAGRLWIGTNDSGIAVYDHGAFRFVTRQDGQPLSAVRCLTQDADGTIMVGTVTATYCIGGDDVVRPWADGQPQCVVSMASGEDGSVIGIQNDGTLFLSKNGVTLASAESRSPDRYYTCVMMKDAHTCLVGTSGNEIVQYSIWNGKLIFEKTIAIGALSCVASLCYDENDHIWISSDAGLGYFDEDGALQELHNANFSGAVEMVHEDYQGNYWVASSRYGVMKLANNRFCDLFAMAGLDAVVVNAVTFYQGDLYVGTDDGLRVVDLATNTAIENALARRIGDTRIRCLDVDKAGRLWICMYGGEGLLCCAPNGAVQAYNSEASGTTGDRFRCLLELDDGTMVVGTSEGLNYIKDGAVRATVTNELRTTQILSLVKDQNGVVYAGSDGSGIYLLQDGKIVGNLTTDDGLSSNIILRMTPYGDGFFIVASNALCYLENGVVRRLDQFNYFNNYDLLLPGDGNAWVLSSRGIFVTDAALLAENGDVQYRLYQRSNGLPNAITANSWNDIDEKGTLYFCCNKGVSSVSMLESPQFGAVCRVGLDTVEADRQPVSSVDGTFYLPKTAKRISIVPAVFNYAAADLQVRFWIDGLDDQPNIMLQSNLGAVQYANVPAGRYTAHLALIDPETNAVYQESAYSVVKQAQFWEHWWFYLYLLIVMVWIVVFVSTVVRLIWNQNKRRNELERQEVLLKEKVREQTRAIHEQAERMTKLQWNVIGGMAELVESRDKGTGQHVRNTAIYVGLIADALRRRGAHPEILTDRYLVCLKQVAPLHDVGKIRVSDVILNKPGRLTPAEFERMKTHARDGGEVIEKVFGENADPFLLKIAKDVATYHHERWDGTGYSAGLCGDQIPLSARIMAVADVFDALVSKRPYKDAYSVAQALQMIRDEAGTHFDPEVVDAFLAQTDALRTICAAQDR